MGPAAAALSLHCPWLDLAALGPVRLSTIFTTLTIAAIVWWRRLVGALRAK